jgi:DNA polymerase-3 subunit alpha
MADRIMSTFLSQFKELDIPLHGVRLPSFDIDIKYKRALGVSEDISNEDFLEALCEDGREKIWSSVHSEDRSEYVERLEHELKTIKDLGFIGYLLLVWDVINFCKENDIPTGLGRGSAAGSLVLYLIGVTKIDPIEYGLFFERFISKIRTKKSVVDGITYLDGSLMMDVDLDICYYNRQRVIEYLETKFVGKTSKIITLNTLSGKLCIKECGKVTASKSEQEMNKVSALIPKVFGQIKDLKEAYAEQEEFRIWCDENEECYNIALKLKGLIKNKGVHPSAISLSFEKLNDSCPTELTSDKKSHVASYDMNWISIFNVKLDILGLRAVSVVDDVCKNVGIKVSDVDLKDQLIYDNLQHLRTPHGLFQIEAETNFRVCQKVKPKDLEELSAVLALARPGALNFVDQYAAYVEDGTYDPIHPFFDDILTSTGGVALYQEQLMKMANKIGFTLDEAEMLRRIVGKKKVKEVRKWKKKIKDKIKENNLEPEIGDILWSVLEDSANYSFNKSHSISYAALAATTIYLKFKYPQQFFLSLLKMTRHEPDPISEISKIQREMYYFGIKLLPPHIIKSDMDFKSEGDDIRFGLLSIKGISDRSIEKLVNFKNHYSNKFEVFEGAKESGLTIGILSALIQAGTFEGFAMSRSKIVYEAQLWNILTKKEKKSAMMLAEPNDYDLVEIVKRISKKKDEKGKPLIKDTRLNTIKTKSEPYKQIYFKNKYSETFANWYYEKHLLGYTYNKNLRDIFSNKKDDLMSLRQVEDSEVDDRVSFIGSVDAKPYMGTSRNGNDYMRMFVEDETGSSKVMIFSRRLEECVVQNNGTAPEESNIVIVNGVKKDEVVFADRIAVQTNKIYTKLSELKND